MVLIFLFRLPDHIKVLQNIEYLSVENTLKSSKEDLSPIVNFLIKEQYSSIHFIK